ncbi:unnamed protein product, partial [Staurois parvus]
MGDIIRQLRWALICGIDVHWYALICGIDGHWHVALMGTDKWHFWGHTDHQCPDDHCQRDSSTGE